MTSDPGPAPSFLATLELHEALQELFARHQEALLSQDLPEATRLLRAFTETIHRHIQDEETHILPLYAQRVAAPEGGGAEFFHVEHRKIKQYLDAFARELAALDPTAPAFKRGIIALLDHEKRLKDLLEHHDGRERSFLYPLLDEATTPEERRAVLARCQLSIPAPAD